MNRSIFRIYSDIYTVAMLRDMKERPAVAEGTKARLPMVDRIRKWIAHA